MEDRAVATREDRAVTMPEFARRLRISDAMAYRLAREDRIPGLIKIGDRYVVGEKTVIAILNGEIKIKDKPEAPAGGLH